jgi:hypothetical protein
VGLGLDGQGRPLIADRDSGLWRLNTGGQLQQLLQSKDKPLIRMTAVTGSGDGWLVATSHLHETSQNSAGMILVHKNQGGLFLINSEAIPSRNVRGLRTRTGSEDYDTYWRRRTTCHRRGRADRLVDAAAPERAWSPSTPARDVAANSPCSESSAFNHEWRCLRTSPDGRFETSLQDP